MRYEIEAFSLQEAWAKLREQFVEKGELLVYNGYIDICVQISKGLKESDFTDLGFLWGYCEAFPGENTNKIKFAIEDRVTPGIKKWESKYFFSPDYPNVENPITYKGITYYDYKNDCDKACKEWVTQYSRSAHVMLKKLPDNFNNTLTSIWYKPSLKQSCGEYVFFD